MALRPILQKKIEHDKSEIFLSQVEIHPHLSSHFLSLEGWAVPWEADSEKELNSQIAREGLLSGATPVWRAVRSASGTGTNGAAVQSRPGLSRP